MFHRKTVFILGAGASHEFGLPIGAALAEQIHTKMDIWFERGTEQVGSGDFDLYYSLSDHFRDNGNNLFPAFRRIREGILFSNSIDDFLDRHDADEYMRLVGKSAIVKTILEAEHRSFLMPKKEASTFDVLPVKDTWILKLVKMLGTGISADRIFENVSFVSFNYDRCLEHFLWQAVGSLYAIPAQELPNIMASLQISYPYGSIGPLRVSRQEDSVPFGRDQYLDYFSLAKNIYTYTEQVRDKKDVAQLQQMLLQAEQIVFLGFGFHSQNMQLLQLPGDMAPKKVFATTYLTSKPNVEVVRDRIVSLFKGNVRPSIIKDHLHNLTAAGLIDEFRLPLTA
jgi:hypothetical protein